MQQQPEEKPGKESSRRGEQIKQGFKESTWVTTGWNWITTFISRGAEPILLICFLIQLYSVLPDTAKIQPSVMNTVFIVQSMTLDIAGIGLIMMCHRLKMDKASSPMKLGNGLLGIMILSLIFAIIKSHTPDTWVYGYIEGALLIVRAILAVIYSPVMHTVNGQLKTLEDEKTIDQQVTERLNAAVQAEISAMAKSFAEMQKSVQPLSVLPAKLTEIESRFALSVSKIESKNETLTPFILGEIERHTDAKMKAFTLENERLYAEKMKGVSEENERQTERRIGEIETKLKGWIERQNERSRVTVSEVSASSTSKKQPIPIAARAKAVSQPTVPQGKREFIFQALEDDPNMSIGEIQKRGDEAGLKLSTGTVSKYRQAFNSGETESKNERDAESEDDEIESAG